MKHLFSFMLLFASCPLASAQQPGQIGAYHGEKLVNGTWFTSALFADYKDADEWIGKQRGPRRVTDENGLLVLGPFDVAAAREIPLPAEAPASPKVGGRGFQWIKTPGSPRTRTTGINR